MKTAFLFYSGLFFIGFFLEKPLWIDELVIEHFFSPVVFTCVLSVNHYLAVSENFN